MSLALFSTIDTPRRAKQRAELDDRDSALSTVVRVGAQVALQQSLILRTKYSILSCYQHINGRVFDARNLSNQSQVGAILTRDWARFRLTKTVFFTRFTDT
jgi:hypothetical protein